MFVAVATSPKVARVVDLNFILASNLIVTTVKGSSNLSFTALKNVSLFLPINPAGVPTPSAGQIISILFASALANSIEKYLLVLPSFIA